MSIIRGEGLRRKVPIVFTGYSFKEFTEDVIKILESKNKRKFEESKSATKECLMCKKEFPITREYFYFSRKNCSSYCKKCFIKKYKKYGNGKKIKEE